MRHNDVIYLVKETFVQDELGNQIPQKKDRMVFANEFSISSAQFYEASRQGLKPEKEFQIYSFEYQNEAKLKHETKEYDVIRTQKNGEKMRITCQRVIANG